MMLRLVSGQTSRYALFPYGPHWILWIVIGIVLELSRHLYLLLALLSVFRDDYIK